MTVQTITDPASVVRLRKLLPYLGSLVDHLALLNGGLLT